MATTPELGRIIVMRRSGEDGGECPVFGSLTIGRCGLTRAQRSLASTRTALPCEWLQQMFRRTWRARCCTAGVVVANPRAGVSGRCAAEPGARALLRCRELAARQMRRGAWSVGTTLRRRVEVADLLLTSAQGPEQVRHRDQAS